MMFWRNRVGTLRIGQFLRFWCVLCFLCVFPAVAMPNSSRACPDGLVAYWRLEESAPPFRDAVNLSDRKNAGCTTQCPSPIDDGVVGSAARFYAAGGTGLKVEGSYELIASGTQNFSIEMWVRGDGMSTGSQILIGRGDADFFWSISILHERKILFKLQDTTDRLVLESTKKLSSPSSPLGARWHHIAVTRDASSGITRLFMDGILQSSIVKIVRGALASPANPLAIGWSGDEINARRFGGSLDEIAIHNRALTAEEIRCHYYLARHYCRLWDSPVRIMPIGDSITFDNCVEDIRFVRKRVAYRHALWRMLSDKGCFFDFIGSEQAGHGYPGFDPDNAGFPGIRPPELAQLLKTSFFGQYVGGATAPTPYLTKFPCDVMLLHVGTVQLNESSQVQDYVDGVRAVLEEVDRYNPHITVLVAKIIHKAGDFTPEDSQGEASVTHEYNQALAQMVNARIAAGAKLVLVDMEKGAGLSYILGDDMHDDLHPNESGYFKMAAMWYEELASFILPVENR